tara:strand:- start:241 stop:378 length:138 start_codon:yes stop_codon:yes gene_type:complete
MKKELYYDNNGLDPPDEYFRKKEHDNDYISYFPQGESETPYILRA